MTLTPNYLLALLLISAIMTAALTIMRPKQARTGALIGMAIMGAVWFLVARSLPLSGVIGPDATAWPQWAWQIGPLSWSVSLAVLLLTLSALALTSPSAARTQPLLIQLLATGALVACWAGNFATYLYSWALLNTIWLIGANLLVHDTQEQTLSIQKQMALAFSGALFLWLAGASAPDASAAIAPESWPTLTRSLVLIAAAFQLLIFPLFLWRSYRRAPAPVAALLHIAPSAAGALLLSRLEAASDIGLAFALPFTLMALLTIFLGARRAWITARRDTLPVALIQAQSGLVLLAAVWAGPSAILGEVTVLLLAGGVLLLAGKPLATAGKRLPFEPGPLIAIAAIAALPLTAGFAGRGATYSAWQEQGHWLLILVSVLLHVPLLAAAFKSLLPSTEKVRVEDEGANIAPEHAGEPSTVNELDLIRLISLLLPALALFNVSAIVQTAPVAWLAILLPILVAALLAWRLEENAELRQTLREAISLPLPRPLAAVDIRRPFSAISAAARDALTLLEGEGGLLWLLVFVVIIYLVR